MFKFVVNEQTAQAGQRAARVVTVIREQPSWVTRLALGAAAFTITAVLLLLIIPAIVIAGAIFIVLALALRLWAWCKNLFASAQPTGRQNVRVISRR